MESVGRGPRFQTFVVFSRRRGDKSRCTPGKGASAPFWPGEGAGQGLLESNYENTWIIGYLSVLNSYTALSNKVKNYDPDYISCDELRFYGNAKPYTWFIEG